MVALGLLVSVAATGMIAYRTGEDSQAAIDLDGPGRARCGAPLAIWMAACPIPRASPYGRRVAVQRTVQGNQDVWLLDGVRTQRFTFDPAVEGRPMWSPTARRIAFTSNRAGCG